jgi:hypothetical protein
MGRWGFFAVAASLPFLLGAQPVAADDARPSAPDVEKICAARACRTGGYQAAVFVDAGHYTLIPVSRSPYILDDGAALVFPGETIAVQFAPDGDKLGPPISAQRYAAHFPALIAKAEEQPVANPEDAALPVVSEKMPADEVAKLPPNSLLISYGQFKQTGDKGMALIVEQNLPQTIKLDAIVAELSPGGGYKLHYTSTCPIMPKMWGNENWPNALGPIVLKNFRFQATGNSFNCE